MNNMVCHICPTYAIVRNVFCVSIGLVRLAGSVAKQRNSLSGRVEVWSNGAWGTVCHNSWDLSDATVVCQQLGYQYAFSAPRNSAFGRGSGPILLDYVECTGNESSIFNCTHQGIGVHSSSYWCTRHYYDASAVCYKGKHYIHLNNYYCFLMLKQLYKQYNYCIMSTDGKLRLNGPGSNTVTTGQVQVSVNGEWGTVCDNAWNLDDATVACHQLGYSGAWTAYYQPGEGLVKVEEPQCTGEETTLLDCWTAQSNGGNAFCSHGRDVAVECMTSSLYGMVVP